MKKVLVIGAQNIDMYARSNTEFKLHDSNISKIDFGYGGVACNIATNLSILGNKVSFLTVFGDDHFSELAKQNLKNLGIEFMESRIVSGMGNSLYLGIIDKSNDLFLGLNDMELVSYLDISFFESKSEYIDGFEILIIDNNLSQESLHYLLTKYNHKTIIMDAVSAIKVKKLEQLLPYVDILKVNILELKAISAKECVDGMIDDLINKGLTSVLVTNSEKDIVFKSSKTNITSRPIQIDNIENSTGAGDAFLSGFVHSYMRNELIEKCIETAKQVAFNCLCSPIATIMK